MVPQVVGAVAGRSRGAGCDRPCSLVGLAQDEFTYRPDDVTGQLKELGQFGRLNVGDRLSTIVLKSHYPVVTNVTID